MSSYSSLSDTTDPDYDSQSEQELAVKENQRLFTQRYVDGLDAEGNPTLKKKLNNAALYYGPLFDAAFAAWRKGHDKTARALSQELLLDPFLPLEHRAQLLVILAELGKTKRQARLDEAMEYLLLAEMVTGHDFSGLKNMINEVRPLWQDRVASSGSGGDTAGHHPSAATDLQHSDDEAQELADLAAEEARILAEIEADDARFIAEEELRAEDQAEYDWEAAADEEYDAEEARGLAELEAEEEQALADLEAEEELAADVEHATEEAEGLALLELEEHIQAAQDELDDEDSAEEEMYAAGFDEDAATAEAAQWLANLRLQAEKEDDEE